MRKQTRKIIFFAAIAIFFLAGPPILFYANGWRITSDFSIKRVGGLFVTAGTTGAEIYFDGKLQKRTNILQQGIFLQGLTPDTVSVLVAKDGYWPWAKDLEIQESFVTEARAFLVPQNITGLTVLEGKYINIHTLPGTKILLLEKQSSAGVTYDFYLPGEDRLFTFLRGSGVLYSPSSFTTFEMQNGDLYIAFPLKTVQVVFNEPAGTATADIVSALKLDDPLSALPHNVVLDSHNQSRLWLSDGDTELRAEWLGNTVLPYYFTEKEISIFKSPSRIKSFDFYPSRRDVVLFAVQNNIFAIELDDRSTRNFQPVYKGRDPYFARIGASIYILDGGSVSRLQTKF